MQRSIVLRRLEEAIVNEGEASNGEFLRVKSTCICQLSKTCSECRVFPPVYTYGSLEIFFYTCVKNRTLRQTSDAEYSYFSFKAFHLLKYVSHLKIASVIPLH